MAKLDRQIGVLEQEVTRPIKTRQEGEDLGREIPWLREEVYRLRF